MILLIHREAVEKNPEKYPLNSNMILLILMSAALTNNNATCFKFQSDSINTATILNQDNEDKQL